MTDPAAGQGPAAAEAGQSGAPGADSGTPAAAVAAQAPAVHDLASILPDEHELEGCDQRGRLQGVWAAPGVLGPHAMGLAAVAPLRRIAARL